jgi:hypothetical protein
LGGGIPSAADLLPPGNGLVEGDVTIQPAARFRLEPPEVKEGPWAWDANPFVGTQPLSGFYVLMVMVDNWDLKTSNNVIYQLKQERDGASRWYVVKDLGASLGANRRLIHGTRNDLAGFEKEPFITSTKDGRVEFNHFHGAWKDKDITPVQWIERLARLTSISGRTIPRCGLFGIRRRSLHHTAPAEGGRWVGATLTSAYSGEYHEIYQFVSHRILRSHHRRGTCLAAERRSEPHRTDVDIHRAVIAVGLGIMASVSSGSQQLPKRSEQMRQPRPLRRRRSP